MKKHFAFHLSLSSMNLLIIHRAKESVSKLFSTFSSSEENQELNTLIDFRKIYPKIRIYYSNGFSKELCELGETGWKECFFLNPKMKFNLILRHGGDKLLHKLLTQIVEKSELKIIFGGNGYAYKPVLKDELHFIRKITKATPFKLFEIELIVTHFKSIKNEMGKPTPTILFNSLLEKNIIVNYKALQSQFSESSISFSKQIESYILSILPTEMVVEDIKKNKTLVLWNNYTPYFNDIESEKLDLKISGGAKKLLQENYDSFKEYGIILICAELNLNEDTPLQIGAGVEVARDLRLLGCKQPIIICSMQEEKSVRLRDSYDILATQRHYFYNLKTQKYNKKLPNRLQPLNEYQWQDIVNFHLQEGKFREIMHSIEGGVMRITEPDKLNKTIEEGFDALKRFFAEQYILNITEIGNLKSEILKSVLEVEGRLKEHGRIRRDFVEAKKERLRLLLTQNNASYLEVTKGWHKILYIEDDPLQRDQLKEEFEKLSAYFKNITNNSESVSKAKTPNLICEAVGSGKEGLEILEKYGDEYPVVIIDWRLLEANKQDWQKEPDWQPLQGLDIVLEVATNPQRFPYHISFFMLTDRAGGILDMAKKEFPYKIHWYAKRNVGRSEVDFLEFANDLIKEGNKIKQTLWSGTPPARWVEPWSGKYKCALGDYYKEYISRNTYEKDKEYINAASEKLLMYAWLLYHQKISELPHKTELLLSLKHNPDKTDLNRFYPKLIGRRVYLRLIEKMDWNREKIAAMLFEKKLIWEEDYLSNNKIGVDEKKRLAKRMSTMKIFITNHLAIPLDEKFILFEEQEWIDELPKKLIDAKSIVIESFYQIILETQNKLEEIIDSNIEMKAIALEKRFETAFWEMESHKDISTKGSDVLNGIFILTKELLFEKYHQPFIESIKEVIDAISGFGLLGKDYPDLVYTCLSVAEFAEYEPDLS